MDSLLGRNPGLGKSQDLFVDLITGKFSKYWSVSQEIQESVMKDEDEGWGKESLFRVPGNCLSLAEYLLPG